MYAVPNSLQEEAIFKLQGTREASIFPGFCAHHDGALFAAVDNPASGTINREAALLICYRTLTKELWVKEQSLAFTLEGKTILDRGKPIAEQVAIQNLLNFQAHQHTLGIGDLARRKARLDSLLSSDGSSLASSFAWFAADLGALIPVVGCGAFCCAGDFLGVECMWNHGNGFTSPETAVLIHGVVPWNGATSVVFGWLSDDTFATACSQVASSFSRLEVDSQRRAIIYFLFEVTENLFVRKSWWDALPDTTRTHLAGRLREGGTNDGHRVDCLVDRGHDLLV